MEKLEKAMALLERSESESITIQSFRNLIQTLVEEHRHGEVDIENSVIKMGFKGAVADMRMFIDAQDEADRILILCVYEMRCCANRRKEVAQIMTAINYRIAVGNYELDFRDGEIRFRIAVPLDKSPVSGSFLMHLIMLAAFSIDKYAKTFTPLCIDMDPDEKTACEEYRQLKRLDSGEMDDEDRLKMALERLRRETAKRNGDKDSADEDVDEDGIDALLALLTGNDDSTEETSATDVKDVDEDE